MAVIDDLRQDAAYAVRQLVRDYLQENDGAAVTQIARATGVSGADVRAFLDSGRLVEITGGSCTCGGVGTRCRYCRSQLAGGFRELEQRMANDLGDSAGTGRGGSSWGARSDDEHGRTSYVRRIRRINEGDS